MKNTQKIIQTEKPPPMPGRPENWRDEIKAYLEAQVEAGGTLYGISADGVYTARTKDGVRIIRQPPKNISE